MRMLRDHRAVQPDKQRGDEHVECATRFANAGPAVHADASGRLGHAAWHGPAWHGPAWHGYPAWHGRPARNDEPTRNDASARDDARRESLHPDQRDPQL